MKDSLTTGFTALDLTVGILDLKAVRYLQCICEIPMIAVDKIEA